eukprot:1556261-Prymnesium_polylepis.1
MLSIGRTKRNSSRRSLAEENAKKAAAAALGFHAGLPTTRFRCTSSVHGGSLSHGGDVLIVGTADHTE